MNLAYHQQRFNFAREQVLGLTEHPMLEQMIIIPGGLEEGMYKCRILYGEKLERIEYEPYRQLQVETLKLVESESISYDHKFGDRRALTELYEQRGECDDILIVKAACISDSYFANVVFWDGEEWLTPDTPLLPGTMRASLLENGSIKEARIMKGDITNYIKIRLINALNDLSGGRDIPIGAVEL